MMKDSTKLVSAGRDHGKHHGVVNTPVYHASTVIFPDLATHDQVRAQRARGEQVVVYGLSGTPTTFALENAVAEIEGGYRAGLVPSGLAAVTTALLACLKAGDHLLMVDSVYEPTRNFCNSVLARYGVETSYYDPLIGARVADQMRPETRVVFVESPGSLTFEVQDVPAIAAAAHVRGALVLMDNTWASPLYFKPFAHGVDVSIQAGTKYLAGHSDLLIGTISATEEAWPAIRETIRMLGLGAGPDDVYLTLRGLRTLGVRLARHQETGLALARWLNGRPEVTRVLHPALPDDPGHALWKRDFLGASGLFGVELKPASRQAVAAMIDHMELFGIGYSWGGFESLIVLTDPQRVRSATSWEGHGPLLRIHAGLEDADDLIKDLESGLSRFNAAL